MRTLIDKVRENMEDEAAKVAHVILDGMPDAEYRDAVGRYQALKWAIDMVDAERKAHQKGAIDD